MEQGSRLDQLKLNSNLPHHRIILEDENKPPDDPNGQSDEEEIHMDESSEDEIGAEFMQESPINLEI
ncbi:alpha/beta-hydrolase [Sesbania bispinosa]|nr:alpha/beta-hydrolase [Sesbania bispinosa]